MHRLRRDLDFSQLAASLTQVWIQADLAFSKHFEGYKSVVNAPKHGGFRIF